jgi:hypothetical protein
MRRQTDGRYHAYLARLILARLTWTTATDDERADAIEMCSESGLKIRDEAVVAENIRLEKVIWARNHSG